LRNAVRDVAFWAVAILAAACAAVLTVVGLDRGAGAHDLAVALTGAVAVLSGALLAVRGTRPRDGSAPARFRQLLGLAMALWGAGQLANLVTGHSYPSYGDVISLVGAPLAVWGLLCVPRAVVGRHPAWRLGLDSVLLGVTVALPAWHFAFAQVLTDQAFDLGVLLAVLVLVADVTVICFATLAWVRDLDRSLLVTAIGAGLYSAGDLASLRGMLGVENDWPWWASLFWCLAWPVITYGLLHYEPSTRLVPGKQADERHAGAQNLPVDPDARGTIITTTASLVLLMISLAALLIDDDSDRVALVLVMVAVAVFGGRELLNTRIRAALLHRLNEEATADPLTGLANRRVLQARMARLQHGEPWCLLTVDLDGFKDVNDLLGHATGDQLLAAVAHRLTAAVPANALVSRIGGDEFAVLLPGSLHVGAQVGQTVVTAVRQSAADVEGVTRVEVSASIGVAAVDARASIEDAVEQASGHLAGDPGTEGSDVPGSPASPIQTVVDPLGALSASGAALRVAKATGRNRVEVYNAHVAQIRQRRLRVEERLRTAVETGAITVQFQPIVDLRRGVVTGAEALARWTDPQLGRVGPDEFITVAEQTGMVVDIGEQILEATLNGAVKEGLFERGLRINCNVSPVQLRVPGFHQVVQEALTAHGAPREQFVIEVTEQVLVEEGQAAQTLHRLAALGLTIAIDDFGTGYSALGYLQRLPADILKIDRALTSSLVSEPRSRAITRAVLDLSRTVGVSVVVEGVETSQVDDLVRRMGVGFGQGLHYGHAMSASDLATMTDRLSRSGP
jgi:diguanylate cyclase